MISKRIPMNSAKKSSFAGLVNYITNSQGKNERVGEITITNCQSDDLRWAVGEVLSTQKQNTRAEGDRTYHLLISFAPGERPSSDVLKDIENKLCACIGYGEHQRISAVHEDTDALHIHIAINKIHPHKLTMHEPYRDFKTRSAMCAKLEIEHGLERVDHSQKKRHSENKAEDMEQHTGIESLINWVRRECLEQIRSADSWGELNQALGENGLELQARGNGFVFVSHDGVMVKASSVHRDLSKAKLEDRYGAFEPAVKPAAPTQNPNRPGSKKPGIGRVGQKPPPKNFRSKKRTIDDIEHVDLGSGQRYEKRPISSRIDTTLLYAEFKIEQTSNIDFRRSSIETVRKGKNDQVEHAKAKARFKRAAIKLMVRSADEKRLLYAFTSRTLREEISAANKHSLEAIQSINQVKARSWADWLQAKAMEGRAEALEALRARGRGNRDKSETLAAKDSTGPAVSRKVPDKQTWDTIIPGDIVTLYRGESAQNQNNGQWWTTDISKAEKYGALLSVTLPAEVLGKHCARGHNGSDEFVFAGKRPADLGGVVIPVTSANRDSITKEGTIIYRAGQSAIRDDGVRLQISKGSDQDGVATALRMAVARYGDQISITGSAKFKELVAQTAAAMNLPIQFTDASLEQRRYQLQQALYKEQSRVRPNSPAETTGTERRRTVVGSDGSDGLDSAQRSSSPGADGPGRNPADGHQRGATGAAGSGQSRGPAEPGDGKRESAVLHARDVRTADRKPGIGRVGRKPPPEAKNRVRGLSELGLVQFADGGPELLPGDVRGNVEQQETDRVHGMRRDVPERGGVEQATVTPRQAAQQYVAEREDKRTKSFDIPKHRLYNGSDDGPATFAGIRQIQGQAMALLKRGDEVLVLPVNEATARRMKRMKLGDPVTATAKGAVKAKGKSR